MIDTGHNTLGGGVFQVSRLQEPLPVTSGLGVIDPDGLLGVVGLGLVGPLHLDVGEQELRGVGSTAPFTNLIWPGMLDVTSLCYKYPGV